MRGLALVALTCALVCALIPWPGLWPLSFGGLALIWFATPARGRR